MQLTSREHHGSSLRTIVEFGVESRVRVIMKEIGRASLASLRLGKCLWLSIVRISNFTSQA